MLDDSGDDREDDESEHVVGDRSTKDGPRLWGRQCSQVAEDASGDADARGGQRGTDEQRGIRRFAERRGGEVAHCHRRGNADHADRERRPTDSAQLVDVSFHTDLGKEDDHADFGEEEHDVAGANPAEYGWTEHDAHADLANDDGNVQAVEDLRGHLGHDEHQGQVEEQTTEVDAIRSGGEHCEHGVRLGANCVGSMSDVCMSCRFTWTRIAANGQT